VNSISSGKEEVGPVQNGLSPDSFTVDIAEEGGLPERYHKSRTRLEISGNLNAEAPALRSQVQTRFIPA
jgi:hypothetical protein